LGTFEQNIEEKWVRIKRIAGKKNRWKKKAKSAQPY